MDACSNGEGPPPRDPNHVNCWACNVLVQVPLLGEDKVQAPLFKCGWCGAISETYAARSAAAAAHEHKRRTCFSRTIKCLSKLQWIVVAIIFALICSIILLGVAYVLPLSCTSHWALYLNHALTLSLTFLILYNYAATVLSSPGSVAECYLLPVGAGQPVHQGAFDNMRYCWLCEAPKPPCAHHCGICKRCVVDQDHHCPFVNNCVGRANLRNFLHFTGWVVAAMLFCICHSSVALLRRYSTIRGALVNAWTRAAPDWDIPYGLFLFLRALRGGDMASLYIVVVSGAILLGVGMLFGSTLSWVASGHGTGATGPRSPWEMMMLRSAQRPHGPGGAGTPIAGHAGSGEALGGSEHGAAGGQVTVTAQPLGGHSQCGPGCNHSLMQELRIRAVNVSRVMGGHGVVAWLRPIWGPPPGVISHEAAKKHA